MINSIETTIAIAFLGSIAIAIAIAIGKAIFLLVGKLLLLLIGFSNYCYCYCYWVLLISNFSSLCSATIDKTIAIAPFWLYCYWYCYC